MKVNTVWVHCAATRPEWMEGQSTAQKVEEIRRWHKARGWRDIGYHWIIDRDGTVKPGRAEDEQGAHVRGHNENSLGVCLIGGHGSDQSDLFSDNFTDEQDKALRALLRQIEQRHGSVRIRGHNDVSPKACPGFNVARWLTRKPARTSPAQSTTIQAGALGSLTTVGAAVTSVGQLDGTAQIALIAGVVVVVLAFAWIARERVKRWARGDR